MGRNVGRYLNFLHDKGYRNLRGVDCNWRAFAEMAVWHQLMHSGAQLFEMSFEKFLTQVDDVVDVAYTRGA